MKRTFLLALVVAGVVSACARAPRPAAPEPQPEPEPVVALDPMTEEEVRTFLLDRIEQERAAEEADHVVIDEDAEAAPFDPADFDLPITMNERVQFWMDYFETRSPDRFALYLSRMGRYEEFIRGKLRERGMPEDLIYLALIESGFSPVARSHASAVGLWQFIAETGRRYGLEITGYVDERRDPIKATDAALDYLSDLYRRFGSWYLAAAAYNTGENRVERLLRRYAGGARGDDDLFWKISDYLPRETRNYVPKLVAAAILAKYPERYGFVGIEPETPDAFDIVTVPDATDLEVIAEAANVETSVIERLNPHFFRGVTPPGRKVAVRVPAGRGEAFAVAYAKIPPEERVRVLEHTIQRGETLSHIARRYGTTVRALQEYNGIKHANRITAGRRIIVRIGPGARGAGTSRALAAATNGASRADGAAPVTAPDRAGAGKGNTAAAANSASTTAAASTKGEVVYTVRAGDSLWSIARKHQISIEDLRGWNRLGSSSRIVPGQKLVIRPAPRVIVHRVEPGDTLWSIARRHGLTLDKLIEWNNLGRDAVIRPGDRLEVPVGG